MSALLRMLLVWIISFVPTAVVVFMIGRQRRARLSSKVAPFQELRRRPSGESLRLKLREYDERSSEYTVMLAFIPAIIALSAWYLRSTSWMTIGSLIAVAAICSTVVGLRLHSTWRERENHSLGFDGERYVGEELSRLIAHGYEVYHDVPFDGFNIDHVLVGPGGVYSVETKTRRKPWSESQGKEYHVQFDGSCLRWPGWTDTHGLDQAAANARTLSHWLGGAVGESVYVTPILTLPGWWVDCTVPHPKVQALNPKQILGVVSQGTERRLSESLIKRICHQLDQKCRIAVG